MDYYNYRQRMKHIANRNKLICNPLIQRETFGVMFFEDKSDYPWEVEYSLGIAHGNDEGDILQKYTEEYVNLLSITSLYLEEGEVDAVSGFVLQITSDALSTLQRVYCHRNEITHIDIKCTLHDNKRIIKLIINGTNVAIYEDNFESLIYPVINHSIGSADALIYRVTAPNSIQELCRQQILNSMDKDLLKHIEEHDITTQLPIPKILQSYMKQSVDEALRLSSELAYLEWIGRVLHHDAKNTKTRTAYIDL